MYQCKHCDFQAEKLHEIGQHARKTHAKRKYKRRAAAPPVPEVQVDGELSLATESLALFDGSEIDNAARARVADWLGARFREVA
jgi:hypothetical protein